MGGPGGRAVAAAALPPFELVVRRYGVDVWRFAASQVGRDRADDVYQETMLAALAAYPGLREPDAVRPWLLRIAARKAVDAFRAAGRTAVPMAGAAIAPHAAGISMAVASVTGAAVAAGAAAEPQPPDDELWAQVRALPAKQRQAVALRFVLDLAYADIGRAMHTSQEAARRNVFEALRTLRRLPPRER